MAKTHSLFLAFSCSLSKLCRNNRSYVFFGAWLRLRTFLFSGENMDIEKIAKLILEVDDEILQNDIEEAPMSVREKRNENAFLREDIGINRAIYPEADNTIERLRTKLYLRFPCCPWISRMYKSRKRRKECMKDCDFITPEEFLKAWSTVYPEDPSEN